MSSVKLLPIESLADAGRFLGRIDKALDNLVPDDDKTCLRDESLLVAARRYHQWDGKNTLGLRNFVHYIKDERRRKLVESILDAFQKEIIDSKVGESFRKGVNHADYNDANILTLMSSDGNLHVSGVIDFGDSVER